MRGREKEREQEKGTGGRKKQGKESEWLSDFSLFGVIPPKFRDVYFQHNNL